MLYDKINKLEKHIKEKESERQDALFSYKVYMADMEQMENAHTKAMNHIYRDIQKMQERYGKMDLKYDDIFEHHVERLTHLEKSVKKYGQTGTNLQKWHSEFKEEMTDEINKKLEELIEAKDERPNVWRKMANVLHRENKNKNLENMQKNMKNMQEEVNDLKSEIDWLKTTKMKEKVNELEEKIKELDKDEVSLPDDPK